MGLRSNASDRERENRRESIQTGDMRRVHVCGRGSSPQLVSPNLRFEVKRVLWPTVQWAKILLFTSTRGSAKGCKGTSLGKILENLVAVGRVGRDEQFRAAPSIFSALLLPPPGVPCSPSNIIKHLLVAVGYPLVSTLWGRKCARIPPDTTGYHPDTTPGYYRIPPPDATRITPWNAI